MQETSEMNGTAMQKTILLTGATDGIGFETARMLFEQGHRVLLHGRSPEKLVDTEKTLNALPGGGRTECYVADLSRMTEVENLAAEVTERHSRLDVLINNAGVLKTPQPVTPEGLDVRFVVNTLAPCLLTQKLLPLIGSSGRIVNLSGDSIQINTDMLDPNAQVKVNRNEIDEMVPSKTSMMPKGALNTLNEDEILDLMAYLLSRGDPNHPVFQREGNSR